VNVLLTGGTGFVGANLARRLLADHHDVTLLTRPQAHRWRLQGIEDSLHLCAGDVADADAVQRAMALARPQWVFHLAAHGAYSFQTDYMAMVSTNVLGTANLIAAASRAHCEALVLTGSSAEYGICDRPPDEAHPPVPTNHYAATKAAATWLAQLSGEDRSSCPVVSLRLYSVYGPWEDPRRLMPTLLSHALDGDWPPLAGRDTLRDFVFCDDVCDAIIATAQQAPLNRGAVYNVGSGVGTTLEQLVRIVAEVLDVRAEPQFGSHPGRSWDARMSWVSNPRRIEAALGWSPATPLATGVSRFAAWLASDAERIGAGGAVASPNR